MSGAKHPGRTKAMRAALDEIGGGNHSPIMAKATRKALLRDGLIVELPPREMPFFGALMMTVRQFEMTIPTHMDWCAYWAEQPMPDEAALRDY